MYAPRLIFYPADIENCVDNYQPLQTTLAEIGLIETNPQQDIFLVGDGFLELLTFMGCAPDIHLSPQDGDNYCYIKFNQIHPQPICAGHVQSFSPSCSACKHKLTHWRETENWQQGSSLLTCPACQHSKPLQQFRWRKEAAYTRCSFYIANIHPHEALPADKLMDALHNSSGFKWAYAYANDLDTL